jgi:hypothetical protein
VLAANAVLTRTRTDYALNTTKTTVEPSRHPRSSSRSVPAARPGTGTLCSAGISDQARLRERKRDCGAMISNQDGGAPEGNGLSKPHPRPKRQSFIHLAPGQTPPPPNNRTSQSAPIGTYVALLEGSTPKNISQKSRNAAHRALLLVASASDRPLVARGSDSERPGLGQRVAYRSPTEISLILLSLSTSCQRPMHWHIDSRHSQCPPHGPSQDYARVHTTKFRR